MVGSHLAGHANILQGAIPVVHDVDPGGGGELGGRASLLPHRRRLRQLHILCGENDKIGRLPEVEQPRFDATQKETGSRAAPTAEPTLRGAAQSELDTAELNHLEQLRRDTA